METVEDFFLSALERNRRSALDAIKAPAKVEPPTGLAREYISGIHREPKAGQIPAPGNRRVPPAYIFVSGKRVSTARSKRFSKN